MDMDVGDVGDIGSNSSWGEFLFCYKTSSVTCSAGYFVGDFPLDFPVPLLLLQIVLILVVSRLVHAILRRIGQPEFISQIIAGIILGPSLLCRNMRFHSVMFPMQGWVNLDIISIIACMLFIFIVGVKTDLNVLRLTGRKALAIAQFGTLLPFFLAMFAALFSQSPSDRNMEFASLLVHISTRWAVTSNSVLACTLDELNLLTSKLGRLALSASLIADLQYMLVSMLVSSGALAVTLRSPEKGFLAFLAFVAFTAFVVFVARPVAMWMIRMTPEGGPMHEAHFLTLLLMALGCGLVGELLGHNAIIGPLMFGLVLPSGPPLGTTLAYRLDRLISGLLLPIYMAVAGLRTNLGSLKDDSDLGFASVLIGVSSTVKFTMVFLVCSYCRMSLRDATVVGLMMSCRGIVELSTINAWYDNNLMDEHLYATNILWIIGVGGLSAGLLKLVYKPSVRFHTHKRRTLQHSHHTTELRVMVCVHQAENVPSLVALLEASHTSRRSALCVYLLHLIPLVGQNAILAPYVKKKRRKRSAFISNMSSHTFTESIVNAFRSLEKKLDSLSVSPFIGMSPYVTMHEDICNLAYEKRSVLVILPFHMHISCGVKHRNLNIQSVNINALRYAPCSVAIFIDHGFVAGPACTVNGGSDIVHRVVVFFLGGADDCEALAYGTRMVDNPAVELNVVRVLLPEELRAGGKDWEDEEAVEMFMGIVDDKRVVYREEVASDGSGTVNVLKKACKNCTLLIVGRRDGEESVLTAGLVEWSEYPELGVIGDMMTEMEFGVKVSTLVVQQQVREKGCKEGDGSHRGTMSRAGAESVRRGVRNHDSGDGKTKEDWVTKEDGVPLRMHGSEKPVKQERL